MSLKYSMTDLFWDLNIITEASFLPTLPLTIVEIAQIVRLMQYDLTRRYVLCSAVRIGAIQEACTYRYDQKEI